MKVTTRICTIKVDHSEISLTFRLDSTARLQRNLRQLLKLNNPKKKSHKTKSKLKGRNRQKLSYPKLLKTRLILRV